MEKEILVQFAAQSKNVVEKVEIKYRGSVEEFDISDKYKNESILNEVISLQEAASAHARRESMKRN